MEASLLGRESLQSTVRLILANGYAVSHPDLTYLLKSINQAVPTLFDTLMPRSEQQTFSEDLEISGTLDDELDMPIYESIQRVQHLKIKAVGQLQDAHCKKIGLPTRSSQMNTNFHRRLISTYGDYQLPRLFDFGNGRLRYCKQMSFTDRNTEHRISHNIGDFIEYDDEGIIQLGRLDYVFVHEAFNEHRLFAIVTNVVEASSVDPVLDLPLRRLSNEGFVGHEGKRFGSRIIGLPVVSASRPYVIPVHASSLGLELDQDVLHLKAYSDSGSKALLHCNKWKVITL